MVAHAVGHPVGHTGHKLAVVAIGGNSLIRDPEVTRPWRTRRGRQRNLRAHR